MWRCSRSAALVAMATALVMVTATPSWPGNTIDSSGKTFKVIVPIDVFADDPGLAKKWTKAITEYWNDGPGLGKWKYCGRRVEFVPDIKVFPRGAKGRPDTHDIYVKLVAPGVDFTSNVKRKGGKFDPAGNSTGVWASNEDNATIAHEFGHFLGLADEYEIISQNPRRSRPLPGFEGSLMAEHDGQINQGLIDKAMINNQADCERWEGSLDWTIEGHPTIEVRFTASVRLDVDPADSIAGSMSGSGVVTDYAGKHPFTSACEIGGHRQATSLVLEFRSCETDPPVPTPGGSMTLAISGTTASGSRTAPYDTLEVTLQCVTCEEAVG